MKGQIEQVPLGWFPNVEVPSEYSVRSDVARRPGGTGFTAGTIISATAAPTSGAMMQQSIRADAYRGQRVRLTGYLKTNIVQGDAGLFVRVDGEQAPLISDFMMDRLIISTKDWSIYSIVVEVPRNAVGITFGFQLTGVGQVWLDDAAFETVGRDVALTFVASPATSNGYAVQSLRDKYRSAPIRPVNLNFEQVRSVAVR